MQKWYLFVSPIAPYPTIRTFFLNLHKISKFVKNEPIPVHPLCDISYWFIIPMPEFEWTPAGTKKKIQFTQFSPFWLPFFKLTLITVQYHRWPLGADARASTLHRYHRSVYVSLTDLIPTDTQQVFLSVYIFLNYFLPCATNSVHQSCQTVVSNVSLSGFAVKELGRCSSH